MKASEKQTWKTTLEEEKKRDQGIFTCVHTFLTGSTATVQEKSEIVAT